MQTTMASYLSFVTSCTHNSHACNAQTVKNLEQVGSFSYVIFNMNWFRSRVRRVLEAGPDLIAMVKSVTVALVVSEITSNDLF